MRERLVEDWLSKVSERSLEVPFCHLLSGEGHTVVHLSRHGETEQGKDILAKDPHGIPCAYQVKCPGRSRLTQRLWDHEVRDQVARLVELRIRHPSIPGSADHRPILVVNGSLDETIRQEIVDRNRRWENRGYRPLEVIVRDDLLRRFISLGSDLWPSELESARTLLELYLSDGRGVVPKARLAGLFRAGM